ncbi:MAG: cation-translocating P-type ATPase [Nitrospiraceae bacterium]
MTNQISDNQTRLWHVMEVEPLCAQLDADTRFGLTQDDAARRLRQYGPNELPEAPPTSILTLLLSQFTSVIIWVLIGAAAISGWLEDWIDAAAILAIVLLNGLLGFVQEYRAEQSLAALRRLTMATAKVLRNGTARSIPARELVPGDLVLVEAGDQIPADARLTYVAGFQAQEASLTGESAPVLKRAEDLVGANAPLAERANMVFMGTVAVSGKGRALVVATGMRTELGRIAAMIQTAAEAERVETPLQRRLEQFGYTLLWLALGVVAVVFVLGELRGEPPVTMFLTAVSLAVAAVPEGLPAIVTITLALGVTRMVKRQALIRKLPAVETLGSATVICSDKTGTLTKNEMTVTRLFMDGQIFEVTGEGYQPQGDIRPVEAATAWAGERHGSASTEPPPGIRELLTTAVLCNGAILQQKDGAWRVLGDPTEGALLVAAAKLNLWKDELESRCRFIEEVPFDPQRKMMTVVRQTGGEATAYVKGAPDVLLQRCTARMTLDGEREPLTDEERKQILNANEAFAHEALRVLAMAERQAIKIPPSLTSDDLERDLVFLGLSAMKDPLRPEAKVAVQVCREAGIQTVMITGDHKDTAVAIARELGILDGDRAALSGVELDRLSDEQLGARIEQVGVYARVSAEHKLRIVKDWRSRGAVVAMTGDGVNDAPAIKEADIGVAMGITGTDVTKEASDMVIMDDNFASIAAAVEEGRGIFDNIRKTIHFLLSCNVSEVMVMLLATLIGLPLPLLPIQILWMNLVTDGFPALALAVDPKAPDLMRQPPRRPDDRLLDRGRLLAIGGQGLMMAVIALGAFAYCLYGLGQELEQARTVVFTVMVLAQLVHAFNCRSADHSLFRLGVTTNPQLLLAFGLSLGAQLGILLVPHAASLFKVGALPLADWGLIAFLGLMPLFIMEIWKVVKSAKTNIRADLG